MRVKIKPSTALIRLNLSGGMPQQETPDLEPLDLPSPAFELLLPARLRAGSILGSLGAHSLAGVAVIVMSPWLAPERLPNYAVRRVPISSIELLLPPLQAPPPPSPPPPAAAPPDGGDATKSGAPAPAPAAPARPKFELPPIPVRPDTELTLLQPPTDLDVPIRPNLRMPPIMAWSVTPRAKLPPKRFVMPGSSAINRQVPQLEAPPKLESPNAMPAVRDLKMAAEIVMDRPPALPVQRATTMPVRTFVPPRPTAPTAPVALQMIDGDALNLVAISPQPVKALGSIPLLPGSQVAAIHEVKAPPNPSLATAAATDPTRAEGATGETGASARSVSGRGPATATGTAEATPSASATGEGVAGRERAAQGTGTGRGAAPVKAGSGASGSAATAAGSGSSGASGPTGGTGTQVVALASDASTGTASEMLPRSTVPIRVEHPESRIFDVVVVQSSAMPNAAAAGILSGSPVYTVYVPVGERATWVMQYCVPKESAIQKRQGIAIQLGNPAPVKAPYPRVTVVPPLGGQEKVVMHGFITEAGEFQDLRVVSGEKAAEELMVLPLLKRWIFRPATRDGKPVTVEIVLVVPTARA